MEDRLVDRMEGRLVDRMEGRSVGRLEDRSEDQKLVLMKMEVEVE